MKWSNVAKSIIFCSFLVGNSWAQTFSGRTITSFYAYQRSDTVDVSSQQSRGYQGFQLNLRQKNLTLSTYGQVDYDFSTPLENDPKLRLFNLYLQWRQIARVAELKLGRMPVFAGVGVGTIDGAQLKIRLGKWGHVKAFGGGLLPPNQKLKVIDNLSDNYMAGGQFRVFPLHGLNVSLSYFNKRQQRASYYAERADSIGNVLKQFVEPSSNAFEFAALDASWLVTPVTSLYARGDYDFNGKKLTRVEFSFRTTVSTRLTLNGAYAYRSPRLPWNSIFSVFNTEENHEFEFGLFYRYRPGVQFFGNGAYIAYPDDSSLRLSLGLNVPIGSMSFVHRSGYAGDLQGLNLYLYRALQQGKLIPKLQFSWASYKLTSEASSRETLLSAAAGMRYRLANRWALDGEIQVLNNRYYSYDTRLLFRLQYRFFTRFGHKAQTKP